METKDSKVESLPAGVVVMMLENLKQTNENQQIVIMFLIAGWFLTVCCFVLWCMPA